MPEGRSSGSSVFALHRGEKPESKREKPVHRKATKSTLFSPGACLVPLEQNGDATTPAPVDRHNYTFSTYIRPPLVFILCLHLIPPSLHSPPSKEFPFLPWDFCDFFFSLGFLWGWPRGCEAKQRSKSCDLYRLDSSPPFLSHPPLPLCFVVES